MNEEVRYFRWKYPDRPLVPVVIGPDGIEPATMFPRALAYRLDADGAITDEPFEVIAVDPRPGKDGEVIGTARIIGRLVRFDDLTLGRFVEDVARRDREERAEADLAERRRQEDRAKADTNHAALLAAIQQERGVPLPVLQAILTTFGHDEALADLGRAEQALRAKADEYLALRDRLNRLTNDDPRVQALRRQAADALATGRFADADPLLAEAEQRDLDVVEELEANAVRRRLSAAATRAERGAAARLGLDYRGAAGHYAEAAQIAPAADKGMRWEYTIWQGIALYDQGNEYGDTSVLRDAIATFEFALGLAPRHRVPLHWATTQNNLGNALGTLGERESGTARLEDAVTAFRAALEERTRDRVPLDWAATQNNLGVALQTLGGRESGTARLEEAVSAFRAALGNL